MSLKLYNTLTRTKEEFVPLADVVTMYVCGPTVYDLSHIGHARTYISFDILNNYLEHLGYNVRYAINITDVDDKILQKSKKENRDAKEFTEEMTKNFLDDFASLGNVKPDLILKVTENIPAIVDFIQVLVDKKCAYETEGNVYFSVKKFEGYGRLSRNDIGKLESGTRVRAEEDKRDPLDFALWKKAKESETVSFESPWGMGRPGWHIECSAMAVKYLGKTLDIHGGGQDLVFPHHEDEVAQSEAANGVQFVRNWVHTGMVNVSGEKMSKSLGNFTTIKDILGIFSPEVLRFHVLKTHYRSPLDFNESGIEDSQKTLLGLQDFAVRLRSADQEGLTQDSIDISQYTKEFFEAMDDDLNTPKALSVIFDLVTRTNVYIENNDISKESVKQIEKFLNNVDSIFNIGLFHNIVEISKDLKILIEYYTKAKESKDYEKVDSLRKEMKDKHEVRVEDTAYGPRIKKA